MRLQRTQMGTTVDGDRDDSLAGRGLQVDIRRGPSAE